MITQDGNAILSASYLSSIGVRFPLHADGRNVIDADGDLLFMGPPRDGARERAEAFARMLNIQADRLGVVTRPHIVPAFADHQAGFRSAVGA